jgi:hypothetical protein
MDGPPPVVLIAALNDGTGRMTARRDGEAGFTAVSDLSDAMMAALSRGVNLVVPRDLLLLTKSEFPPELPGWIRIE